MSNRLVSNDVHHIELRKKDETYVFLFRDCDRAEALRALGRHASNPELSFTWYDAALLSQRIRKQSQPG